MKKRLNILLLGLAIFTMLFSSGNIVFSLILGRDVDSLINLSLLGFVVTAVLVPILGLSSVILLKGDYKKLLDYYGKTASFIIIFVIMVFLLGPMGSLTRGVIVSYAAFEYYVPSVPIWLYTFFFVILIYLCTYKESTVVELISKILGPIKLILLFAIIALGLFTLKAYEKSSFTPVMSVFHGFHEGYYTLDLLGTIFFAYLIYNGMQIKFGPKKESKDIILICLKAGFVCAILLGAVYYAFGNISAAWSSQFKNAAQEQLLTLIAIKVLGQWAGFIANVAIIVAIFVTSIATTTVFADYASNILLKKRVSYNATLIATLLIVLLFANLKFSGIMEIIGPIATLLYPSLIVLSFLNILNVFYGLKTIYISVLSWATLIITAFFQYIYTSI